MTDVFSKPEPLMTMADVATFLQVSRSTAFRLKKEQNWPCIMLGSQPRFDQSDLEAIINMNRKESPSMKVTPNVGTRANRGNAQNRLGQSAESPQEARKPPKVGSRRQR
ncbi:AlpA family transcriptional regulator [Arthrobacter sp. Leaf137]|uniref:helix-turn-helix transcriptional regulator n=1 Tax=Arthrobacter sp. Leaf137 TaxID=1736271 RepID=UPI0012E0F7DA|nr:helix-turn-helix domain-containing protein [Arthrobacter sp. Leaf137]